MSPLPPPRSKLPPPRKQKPKVLAQESLFYIEPDWTQEWKGMPEFVCEDLSPFRQIIISFASDTDVKRFAEVTGLVITGETRSTWYPKAEMDRVAHLRYIDSNGSSMQHRYVEWKKSEWKLPANIPRELPDEVMERVVAYDTCMEVLTNGQTS